ncbi:MAG: hypothetical protein AAGD10_07680 [Myxococcota bacterium]
MRLPLFLSLMALPVTAWSQTVHQGDPIHGRTLFSKYCGADAARATLSAADMTAIQDGALQAAFGQGQCVDSAKTFSGADVDFLSAWDMVAFVRTRHLGLADFFPEAARYLLKEYTIDNFGEDRLKENLGRLPSDRTHPVYTMYDFEGEKGRLAFVPQDPLLIDELERDKKLGYLVFLSMETPHGRAEVGIAVDAKGVVRSAQVHRTEKEAEKVNAALAVFEGQGRLGGPGKFEAPRRSPATAYVDAFREAYLLAMESVTMFVREERDRTWSN